MTFGKVHLNSILVQTLPSLHPVTLSPKTEFDQALSIGQFKLYSCYMVMALVGALILGFVMFKLLCRKQNSANNNTTNHQNTVETGGESGIEINHRLMRMLLR